MHDRPDTDSPWHDTRAAQSLAALAAEGAPRLFAVAVEYEGGEGACIAAYGLAFADRAEIVSTEGGFTATLCEPENALRLFTEQGETIPHLLWLPPTQQRHSTTAAAKTTA
ncbi:hypothetical protein AB0I60_22775 [Actinosynnema sp. NPDC050436]|uniref:hypothetical protein n=1 Tax=Actinosynnema sp. NPDC050436 TaxID=3155659 RepID=UPI0033F4D580